MSLRLSDLDYELPEHVIATAPAEPRDAAKLMVLWRSEPGRIEHATVRDLPRFLRAGDLLVVNQTRVLRARLLGTRVDTGGKVQGLYLGNAQTHEGMTAHRLESLSHQEPHRLESLCHQDPGIPRRWVVMLQGKSMRPGIVVRMVGADGTAADLRLLERDANEHAAWVVEVVSGDAREANGPEGDAAVLERVGWTPLPPYILKARTQRGEAGDEGYDRARYQTVFAQGPASMPAGAPAPKREEPGQGPGDVGSVAAPTAGLHLTDRVLADLDRAGVARTAVTLHVGSGTFKPVEAPTLAEHRMHTEWCSLDEPARRAIAAARSAGGRVICVGTTSARTVESFAMAAERGGGGGGDGAAYGWLATDILIEPGYRWRWTDGLLTNFHLPRTTLLAMVASVLGREDEDGASSVARLKAAYAEALSRGYRFFSYGDALLILP